MRIRKMTNTSLLKQPANKVKFMNNRVEILEALCIFFATIACSAKTAYLQKYTASISRSRSAHRIGAQVGSSYSVLFSTTFTSNRCVWSLMGFVFLAFVCHYTFVHSRFYLSLTLTRHFVSVRTIHFNKTIIYWVINHGRSTKKRS